MLFLGLVVISLFHLTGIGVGSLLIPRNQIMYVEETQNDGELEDIFKSLERSGARVLPLTFTEIPLLWYVGQYSAFLQWDVWGAPSSCWARPGIGEMWMIARVPLKAH